MSGTDRVEVEVSNGIATVTGSGPETIVFLHAVGTDRRVWRAVTSWMPSGVRCVAIDLQGFGSASSRPPESLSAHSDDVLAVLDQLGIERAHLVGHSYGGAVAATLAFARPDRVSSLALVASIISAPSALFEERADSADRNGVESYVESTIERWFTAEELVYRGRPVEYIGEVLRQTPLESWAAGWRILARHDIAARLHELAVPATIVAGELDTAIPIAQLQLAANRIPDASFAVIAGGAHMLPIEKPFELGQILYSSIRRNHGDKP